MSEDERRVTGGSGGSDGASRSGGSGGSDAFGPAEVAGGFEGARERGAFGGFGGHGEFGGPGGFGAYGGAGGVGPGSGGGSGFGSGGFPAPPPVPPAAPQGPAEPVRAVAVALLNLSGLGLGYALLRRWVAAAVCWAVTGLFLLLALPADADGVPRGAVTGYALFLLATAAHGAVRGLRSPLAWPPRAPIAALLGLVLLAVPAGGVVFYQQAREEAVQQALLERLAEADKLVAWGRDEPSFDAAKPAFTQALEAYQNLQDDHPDSRAAAKVPDRMAGYYRAVAAPYDDKKYCDAIERLKYLRSLPSTVGEKRLGTLAAWPDERLAASLYACGAADIGKDAAVAQGGGNLAELFALFPASDQTAKVEPALRTAIGTAARDIRGPGPCAATDTLITLRTQASSLLGKEAGVAGALKKDAATAGGHIASGTYACGVDEYRNGDFDKALTTMNDFVLKYRGDKNRPRAQKIAIAAEIAKSVPAAGKRLPTTASGGSISVTIRNDSPDEVEVLYTGPVTGKVTLKGCSGCTRYSSAASAAVSACKGSRNYPEKTISLPAGTTYFLHKSAGPANTSAGSDTASLQPGYIYTECAYVVEGGFGTSPLL
ncbi:hypothetical protein AB0O07_05305 [Streptomyces sp. NPDC093085]|uniref:hypothetical protein n=1 Tax=Streptomyces sp. NPDC093085 TaxID=3155068 RepID=UPI00344A09BC